jgi:hypothetical protein
MFPSVDTSVCFPLPSSGSLFRARWRRRSSPPSPVLWGRKTPLRPSRQSSVSLDWTVPPPNASFAPLAGAFVPAGGLVRCGRVDHACSLLEETMRSPRFLGNPLESVPWSGDSGGSYGNLAYIGCPDAAFGQANNLGSRNGETISELATHGLLPCCLRFAPRVAPGKRKTHYRPARYGFDRVGLSPTGLHSEVSVSSF